jgi:uncharacterized membrane protein
MKVLRRYHVALLFVTLAFLFVAVAFRHLPQQIPIRWGTDGQANDWLGKPWGALLLPLVALGATLLLIFAPSVIRSEFDIDLPSRFYPSIVAAFAGFLAFVTGVQLLLATGSPLNLQRLIVAAAGGLLAVTGNYLGKVPRNHLIGIRTPWTLSSGYVWERTHRFAAPVFVLCGLVLVLYALFEEGLPSPRVVLFVIGMMVSLPTVYSYLLWRRKL